MPRLRAPGRSPAPLILLALVLSACEYGTGVPDDEPDGLIITQGTATVVRVTGRRVTGSLAAGAGESSPTLLVTFTDGTGYALPTAGRYMEAAVASPSLATFQQTVAGGFSGRLRGNAPGSTSIVFALREGSPGSGAALYSSPSIPVRIE